MNQTAPYPTELMADTIGQLMEFWGFKHIMGRIWTVLYLSPKPLTAPELCDQLGVSTGGISMALRDLVEWGAIRRLCPRESRKDHYVAESNIWKMLSRVLQERESRRIEFAMESLDEAIKTLRHSSDKAVADFQIRRLEELRKLATLGNRLLKLLLAGAKVDMSPLRGLFESQDRDADNPAEMEADPTTHPIARSLP